MPAQLFTANPGDLLFNPLMTNPMIVALDVPQAETALQFARELANVVGAFKIGSELFTGAGPDIVRRIRATGAAVFLDQIGRASCRERV